MTIVASVKVRDGIVLATDSRSQLTVRNEVGQVGVAKIFDNARKLFQIRDFPIGIMSFGLGNIGARSIESLVLEFSRRLSELVKEEPKLETISKGLYEFISGIYHEEFKSVPIEQQRQNLRLGFFIGGYSPGKFLAEEWEFELPDTKEAKPVRAVDKFGSSWRGIPIPFSRLYNGYDPRIPAKLKEAGVSDEILSQVFKVDNWRMPIAYSGMPVQDAINFAVYILETTIGASNFEIGPTPTCGAPIQLAVILPDNGWQWVRRPELTIG